MGWKAAQDSVEETSVSTTWALGTAEIVWFILKPTGSVEAASSGLCLHAKSLQSCLTLFNPVDCSPPGSSVQGIPQARYWSVLPCPPSGDLPDTGIEPVSLMPPERAGGFLTSSVT